MSKFLNLKEIIVMLIVAGILLAMLRHFNWDFGAMFEWFIHTAYNVIDRIANFFTRISS